MHCLYGCNFQTSNFSCGSCYECFHDLGQSWLPWYQGDITSMVGVPSRFQTLIGTRSHVATLLNHAKYLSYRLYATLLMFLSDFYHVCGSIWVFVILGVQRANVPYSLFYKVMKYVSFSTYLVLQSGRLAHQHYGNCTCLGYKGSWKWTYWLLSKIMQRAFPFSS